MPRYLSVQAAGLVPGLSRRADAASQLCPPKGSACLSNRLVREQKVRYRFREDQEILDPKEKAKEQCNSHAQPNDCRGRTHPWWHVGYGNDSTLPDEARDRLLFSG
jgi:hypothetical protein